MNVKLNTLTIAVTMGLMTTSALATENTALLAY